MAIREITTSEPATITTRRAEMMRVLVTEDQEIFAIWRIEKGGRVREFSVPVGKALRDNIVARPGFISILNAIRDDTHPRTNV